MIATIRNPAKEWPHDAPPGTFDIFPHKDPSRPAATSFLFYICPNGRSCGVAIGPLAVAEGGCNTWGWDGKIDAPTVTPSINCTGGCGWHGFVTAGRMG